MASRCQDRTHKGACKPHGDATDTSRGIAHTPIRPPSPKDYR